MIGSTCANITYAANKCSEVGLEINMRQG